MAAPTKAGVVTTGALLLFLASAALLATDLHLRSTQPPLSTAEVPPGAEEAINANLDEVGLGGNAQQLKGILDKLVEKVPAIVERLDTDLKEAKEDFVRQGGPRDHLQETRSHLESAVAGLKGFQLDDARGPDANEAALREYLGGLARSLPKILDSVEGDIGVMQEDFEHERDMVQEHFHETQSEIEAGVGAAQRIAQARAAARGAQEAQQGAPAG
mmetsp:Transcript_7088/g.24185  ORF Transcript_7088/g.24185 Transcript_7088/m.24185 type:complete len:216 (-) Transcript_7088:195-842(-)